MITQKSEFKSFAAFYGVGHRWTSYDKTVVLDAGKGFELLEFTDECILMFLCDFGSGCE